ncbi:hypothetical protein B0H17DRAFT_1128197 [Mycena rosella]|uniref:Uncharacterized protein n=1 Tax=Mycena rosella TaxID=1033263 RepID=A0AAD7GPK2_MYCRO|nr:hypothetical protein B0H17DRAFT_1128197 [Mycena rosella]
MSGFHLGDSDPPKNVHSQRGISGFSFLTRLTAHQSVHPRVRGSQRDIETKRTTAGPARTEDLGTSADGGGGGEAVHYVVVDAGAVSWLVGGVNVLVAMKTFGAAPHGQAQLAANPVRNRRGGGLGGVEVRGPGAIQSGRARTWTPHVRRLGRDGVIRFYPTPGPGRPVYQKRWNCATRLLAWFANRESKPGDQYLRGTGMPLCCRPIWGTLHTRPAVRFARVATTCGAVQSLHRTARTGGTHLARANQWHAGIWRSGAGVRWFERELELEPVELELEPTEQLDLEPELDLEPKLEPVEPVELEQLNSTSHPSNPSNLNPLNSNCFSNPIPNPSHSTPTSPAPQLDRTAPSTYPHPR